MAHGGGEEGGENSERWLVSYSDFITLLMVLFVVLYSMGQVDVEKTNAGRKACAMPLPWGAAARKT
jgi:chemotaxis protein MotB